MKFLDFVIFVMLVAMLALGMYLLWMNFPKAETESDEYIANLSSDLPEKSVQFHPNMRYARNTITYFIAQNCSAKKTNDFLEAVNYLEDRTRLNFEYSVRPDILVACSNIAPEPDEEGHFVAGEGGPSTILNATRFAVIQVGRIGLYRAETCETPQVALHELLHALGFDHNNNKSSIMFPVTDCKQVLDDYIVEEINRLYSIPSKGDLVIEKASANKTGKYLSFEVTIANYGLVNVKESRLKVSSESGLTKEFDTQNVDVGARKSLTITNLKVPSDTTSISLEVETQEGEILDSNNKAEINLKASNL